MIHIGWLYAWPDGTVVEVTGVSYAGRIQTRFAIEDTLSGVGIGDIGAADMKALLNEGIVKMIGPKPEDGA